MALVTIEDVHLEFGDQRIFRQANLILESGERVCLIGRNGAGKSTLFKLITGGVEVDQGEIRKRAGLRVSQLEQSLPGESELSVEAYVARGLAAHKDLIERFRVMSATELDESGLRDLEAIQREIEAHGGWDPDTQVNTTISALELPAARRLSELSGGWQRRVALGRALVSQPDLLLLDEPTNHLDLATIQWLEHKIRSYPGTVLFITHDRAFLQALATRIVDIDRGQLKSWPGDYQRYLKLKTRALEVEDRENREFDKKLQEEESWIRQGIKARRTRNEGRVRALEQMRLDAAERIKREGQARIAVQSAEISSRRVIQARNISYSYGEQTIFSDLSLKIMRGDRIGLIGNNGVGKSTLLRVLLGELKPDSGSIKFGENLITGYFDQLRRELDPKRSAADVVGDGRDYIQINGKDRHVVGYLRGFLFTAKRAMTPLGYLSGGERNRVILAHLFSRASNLLVLDEPTNDLDVETLEVLENELGEYDGTLIVVSHDRMFLDQVVTSTLVFERDGNIERYAGGYTDWLRHGRTLAATDDAPGVSHPTSAGKDPAPSVTTAPTPPRTAKLSYKLKYELEQLPEKIEALESRQADLDAEIASPGFYQRDYAEVQPILDELAAVQGELDAAMTRWDELETLQQGTDV